MSFYAEEFKLKRSAPSFVPKHFSPDSLPSTAKPLSTTLPPPPAFSSSPPSSSSLFAKGNFFLDGF